MARPGIFDTDGVPWGWFDTCGQDQGWFDRDLLTYPPSQPPPPPPPPPPRPPRQIGSGGGGGGAAIPYCPPDWLRPFFPQYLPDECDDDGDDDADFALIHITEGAAIRALAAGVVESFVDDRGRSSLVLTADDGTRYWYADLGSYEVASGARVRARQLIARTKPGASPLPPTMLAGGAGGETGPRSIDGSAPPALPPRGAAPPAPPNTKPKQKPAQVVFVEAPPDPADASPSRPPTSPPRPALQIFKLVKVPPVDDPVPPLPSPSVGTTILRTAARVGVIAAILYALSFLVPKKKPLPRPRKKKRKRRPARRRRR